MSLGTVSATIQDPSGQVFANGTWQLIFKPAYSVPGIFTDGGALFTTSYSGFLDTTGSFSQAVNRNDTIAPANSRWTLIVTPNANGQAYSVDLNVNSGALNATVAINAVITNITVPATSLAHAYKDAEVIVPPSSGAQYYDVVNKALKTWDLSSSSWITNLNSLNGVLLNPTGNQLINQPAGTNFDVTQFGQEIHVLPSSPGADMGIKIQNAINSLPSGGTNSGGIIDATAFTGDQTWSTTLTMGIANQCIVLKLGLVRIISQQNPVINVPAQVCARILGSGNIAGAASNTSGGTQIVHNGAANDGIDWFGSNGELSNMLILAGFNNTGTSLLIKAIAGKNAQKNFVYNVGFNGPGSTVAGSSGIVLSSDTAISLNTENVFTEIFVNSYADHIKFITTNNQGPTDNWFNGFSILGGGGTGNGINIQKGDINWFYGGIVASCATGVITTSTCTQNAFAIRLESNTTNINNAGIGTVFMPINVDANTITDTGTNTVIVGAAQAAILQKLGNAGGFQMNPPVGIGQPPQGFAALFVQPLQTLTGGTQIGAQFVPQTSSAATANGIGVAARADLGGVFTQAQNIGYRVDTPTLNGGTITEWDGMLINAAPVAGTKFAIKSLAAAPAQFADNVQSKRLKGNQGTAYTAADAAIVLSAGWGTTRTVSAGTGFDQAFSFNVNATGTGQAANPTITITFKDGSWTNAPQFLVLRNDIITPFNTPPHTIAITATTLTITFNGTPTAANVYSFICLAMGV